MRTSAAAQAALASLAMAGAALMAPNAWAQRINCMAVPLAGAKATADNRSLTGPMAVNDCASLKVQEGLVQVAYVTRAEGVKIIPFAPGQPIALPDARPESSAVGKVAEALNPEAVRSGGPGSKAAFPTGASAEAYGGPVRRVYLPPGGLRFMLRGAAGGTWRVIAVAGGAELLRGSADSPVVLPAERLPGGARYRFELSLGNGVLASSDFNVANEEKSRAVSQLLAELEATPGTDPRALALGRAMLFEQQALTFNSELAVLQGGRP